MAEKSYSFDTKEIPGFTVVDYVLFGLMLAFSASIGIFYAIKDRNRANTKEFLLAGGNMNPIPVALSILASFMSAITLLGTPAEMYNYTTMYWYIGLGYLFVVAGAAHIFIPVFYRLRVTSAYEVCILVIQIEIHIMFWGFRVHINQLGHLFILKRMVSITDLFY